VFSKSSTGQGQEVRPFNATSAVPSLGNAIRVSNEGALGTPRWRRDDREIYYLSQEGEWTAVAVTLDAFSAGVPVALLRPPPDFVKGTPGPTASSDVSADGERFVLLVPHR
jgi:hypothetical protein